MSWALGFGLAALALLLVNRLSHGGLPPVLGIALSIAVLMLRASLSASLAVLCVYYLPTTEVFEFIVTLCGHAGLPWSSAPMHVPLGPLGNVATLFPGLLLAASGSLTMISLWWGSRRAREWLAQSVLRDGPSESLIVGGNGVFLAAAGVRSPRIVVSTGALLSLEGAELEAGLEHERAHIVRRHPRLRVVGVALGALGCLLPGGQGVQRSLRFHLERDADEYAVRRTGNPLALAAAIYKGAGSPVGEVAALHLDGEGASDRLRALLDRDRRPRMVDLLGAVVAVAALSTLAILVVMSIPLLLQIGTGHLVATGTVGYPCHA